MSTIQDTQTEPVAGSPADPFRYGWRYVPVKRADGRVDLEQIPLTLEDLFFPKEGDFVVQAPDHVNDCLFLKMGFESRLASEPESLVLYDSRVDWNLPGVRPLGPDLAVFLGVPSDFNLGTLSLAEENATPVLVVEVTSPETRKNDFGIKKDLYHQAGVPFYIIIDARPRFKRPRVRLHGFRHAPEGYEPIPLDDEGRLWIEPLGIWLAVADGQVTCIDGETGEPIGSYVDQVRARIEAVARAQALSRFAEHAKARAESEIWNRMMVQAQA